MYCKQSKKNGIKQEVEKGPRDLCTYCFIFWGLLLFKTLAFIRKYIDKVIYENFDAPLLNSLFK
jgi:hypothetical protein